MYERARCLHARYFLNLAIDRTPSECECRGVYLWIASNVIDYRTGEHNNNVSHQFFMRNAQDDAVSQGKLRSSNPHRYYPILSAL
jgi:hypothetical protein